MLVTLKTVKVKAQDMKAYGHSTKFHGAVEGDQTDDTSTPEGMIL